MAKASDEILAAMHEALAADLLKRIRAGEATAADLNVARAFLKDNGINAAPTPGSPLAGVMESLPFQATEDDDTVYN